MAGAVIKYLLLGRSYRKCHYCCTYTGIYIYISKCIGAYTQDIGFLISSYGATLVQRASYLALHSISSLLIGLKCVPNSTHTTH